MKKIKLLLTLSLLIGLAAGCTNNANKVTTLVTLDVNPNIQLKFNDDDKVLEAVAGNDDAKKILEGMDLKNVDADVALNAILGSLVKEGYLTSENNTVLLSVENDDDKKRIELEDDLSKSIQTLLKDYSIESAVLSQKLDIDDDMEQLIKKYDISYGKATLIEKILDDDKQKKYKIEDLVKLNAQDLVLIYQTVETDTDDHLFGNVSTQKYLTNEAALDIALNDAGLDKSEITTFEIDYDIENGVLTYEIEFSTVDREYEYEINAIEGIIEREVDNDDNDDTDDDNDDTDDNVDDDINDDHNDDDIDD